MWVQLSLRSLLYVVGLFAVTFTLSIVLIGALLVYLPPTFFLDSHNRNLWIDRHPLLRFMGRVIKNIAGIGLILFGLLLSLPGIPGQGLLTILVGLVLVDFPGKRQLERRTIGRPAIRKGIDRLRQRFGKPPLVLSESTSDAQQTETTCTARELHDKDDRSA